MAQAPSAPWRDNRRGAAAMAAGMVLITVNDALIKLASETLPAAQTVAVRGGFASLVILAVLLARGELGAVRQALEPRTLFRAVLDVAGTFGYLLALFNMAIADATAINMSAPLMMVGLAVIFLGEHVPWRRWAAVLAGFAGMLLVVRPGGEAFTWWAALCLAATALNAVRDIYTRSIPRRVPALAISLVTALAVTLTGSAVSFVTGWQAMAWREVALLAAASTLVAAFYYLMVLAMRIGDVSVVGGFRYTALLAAAVLGWAVWGQVPDLLSGLGMVVVVAAGLAVLRGERRA